ncbi:MAG: hypothetical protein MUE41_01250 [Gemmatimonadaceae bacterium]|jgi:hypothetical protein|nr:hypothetical protein [Gemmatimonadaceae bacterium]
MAPLYEFGQHYPHTLAHAADVALRAAPMGLLADRHGTRFSKVVTRFLNAA